ncbi:MAG: efflux RND transporter periplasmic adaptor subunit [Proteobacteria bacterium]|nr:efflux RND transporter periplasmic adaptor subunit [Pseudomonadota bacterium]
MSSLRSSLSSLIPPCRAGGFRYAPYLITVATLLLTGVPPALAAADAAPGAALATAPVTSGGHVERTGFDGVVEAVRQTEVAAQVQGAVMALPVKAGDKVRAGQVLVRLDARAAEQTAAASAAQVEATQAARDAAAREYERQQQLFAKHYISQAALDRAEAQYKAKQAETAARLASASAARAQSGFYAIHAPYDAIVADVNAVLGDMAMPGRPLLTVYDPTALRVRVMVPESAVSAAITPQQIEIRLAGGNTLSPTPLPPAGEGDKMAAAMSTTLRPVALQWLPATDPNTHTRELRLMLPVDLANARPGQFARVELPMSESASDNASQRLYVPAAAIVRRAELTAVYVVGQDGKPLLRQVRLGPAAGDRVEVLAGLNANERVALDPQAAARVR